MQNLNNSKQPSILYLFSLAYMGERFGYFMMRGMMVLYMTKVLLFSTDHAYSIFSGFTALLYLTPLIGAPLADKYIGNKQAVIIGGLLLSFGLVLLGLSESNHMYTALAILICGKGLYAPNIITSIGKVYQENDLRREGGFSIVYTAINISAIIPPLISASIIFYFGWSIAFLLAGIITGLGVFLFGMVNRNQITIDKINHYILLFLCLLLSIYLFELFLRNAKFSLIILITLSVMLTFYGVQKILGYSYHDRQRLILCLALTTFSIIFFALSQQSAMSLVLFTENHVNKSIWIFNLPTIFFFALNPFFIITMGPLFSILWSKLAIKNSNPPIFVKFILGNIFLGLGFIILLFAISFMQSDEGQINVGWIVISYFLQSIGELFIFPIGLAMITKYSPKDSMGFMVGIWYCAIAIGSTIAGWISHLTITSKTTDPLLNSMTYAHIFGSIGMIAILTGILLIPFIRYFKKSYLTTENFGCA